MVVRCMIILMAFSLGSQALAKKRKYGRAGCGLGSVLFGPKGNQSSASSTNNSSYNQGLAITSGTSNCVADNSKWSAIDNQSF